MNDFNVTELTEADQRELTRAANNPMELRNIRRKINNRVASAASRERKQILISELKQRICDLEGLNRTLVDQVRELLLENSVIKSVLLTTAIPAFTSLATSESSNILPTNSGTFASAAISTVVPLQTTPVVSVATSFQKNESACSIEPLAGSVFPFCGVDPVSTHWSNATTPDYDLSEHSSMMSTLHSPHPHNYLMPHSPHAYFTEAPGSPSTMSFQQQSQRHDSDSASGSGTSSPLSFPFLARALPTESQDYTFMPQMFVQSYNTAHNPPAPSTDPYYSSTSSSFTMPSPLRLTSLYSNGSMSRGSMFLALVVATLCLLSVVGVFDTKSVAVGPGVPSISPRDLDVSTTGRGDTSTDGVVQNSAVSVITASTLLAQLNLMNTHLSENVPAMTYSTERRLASLSENVMSTDAVATAIQILNTALMSSSGSDTVSTSVSLSSEYQTNSVNNQPATTGLSDFAWKLFQHHLHHTWLPLLQRHYLANPISPVPTITSATTSSNTRSTANNYNAQRTEASQRTDALNASEPIAFLFCPHVIQFKPPTAVIPSSHVSTAVSTTVTSASSLDASVTVLKRRPLRNTASTSTGPTIVMSHSATGGNTSSTSSDDLLTFIVPTQALAQVPFKTVGGRAFDLSYYQNAQVTGEDASLALTELTCQVYSVRRIGSSSA